MVRARWLCLLALVWANASPAEAQSSLFSNDAPLQIVIDAPFPAMVRAAKTNTNPYPATLSVTDGVGAVHTLSIQVNARGKTRRTAGYCQFPPILLRFDKAAARTSIFTGQNELKLVTYCRPQSDYEQRVVLEYLAYRLYNLVTPFSYRVRAAQVTYRNGDRGAGLTRFGFLIEDLDDVADRNRRKKLKAAARQLSASQLDARAAARASLFEFMIGNLDWDFLSGPAGSDCCHNSRPIAAPGAAAAAATAIVPLPYDFDYSGLVDAPYAGPPPGFPVNRLTDRFYRGYCVSSSEIPAVVEEYRARRADIMAVISSEPRLNAAYRAKATRFMEGFFAVLDDPERVQSKIVKRCR